MAVIKNFPDLSHQLPCLSQLFCVDPAKIEHISLCISQCLCICVYICECVKVGGGSEWENTPVCGLTKLSFCP